ncbi:toprim domain-containing protein [Olleya marilimosa]|uniref:Toprim domain-containing protein n=1 Tax=Olleya marilimosa TaxID=272164 RepID=A0ABR8LWV8_9FLAO|nr:toprim domain-containing protein [Olleya marilimosa]MBD3892138.1 toprim domain-containing protein [Olleya marilimosa]
MPYKNEDGYYSCLFGEHLLDVIENKEKAVMLVESEKTAIVCAMHYPEYIWLAYGGITALTNEKIQVLIGRKVILIPDMSEKAVAIMTKKISEFEERQIDVKIWDLTYGKTDKVLMESGWYNSDLEDVLRTDKTI